MAPHSSTLAWKIPWTEEPGRLQSMGSLRVGHDWATSLSLFTCMHWRRKWQPTPVFLPGESQGWAAVYGVAQSRTQLKWLSSSSSRYICIILVSNTKKKRYLIKHWIFDICGNFSVCCPNINCRKNEIKQGKSKEGKSFKFRKVRWKTVVYRDNGKK